MLLDISPISGGSGAAILLLLVVVVVALIIVTLAAALAIFYVVRSRRANATRTAFASQFDAGNSAEPRS